MSTSNDSPVGEEIKDDSKSTNDLKDNLKIDNENKLIEKSMERLKLDEIKTDLIDDGLIKIEIKTTAEEAAQELLSNNKTTIKVTYSSVKPLIPPPPPMPNLNSNNTPSINQQIPIPPPPPLPLNLNNNNIPLPPPLPFNLNDSNQNGNIPPLPPPLPPFLNASIPPPPLPNLNNSINQQLVNHLVKKRIVYNPKCLMKVRKREIVLIITFSNN